MPPQVLKRSLPVLKNIIHKCNLKTWMEGRQLCSMTYSQLRCHYQSMKHTDKTMTSISLHSSKCVLPPMLRVTFVTQRGFKTRDKNLPIIYLFTKDSCTLCDEAKAVLKPYMHRFTLEEVDITLPENADWFDLYKYDIPVFHMYEDFLFKHRVDLEVLEKALKDHENQQRTS